MQIKISNGTPTHVIGNVGHPLVQGHIPRVLNNS